MGMHAGPIVQTARLAVPARRRQVRIAIVLFLGVVGVAAVMVYLLLPRSREIVLSSWDEAAVSRRDLPQTVEASGTVVTESERDVSSPERGIVGALLVGEGDRVRRGELLLTVQSSELGDQLAEERVRLAKAERDLARQRVEREYQLRRNELLMEELVGKLRDAEAEEARVGDLVKLGALSASELEKARKTTESARRAIEKERVDREGSAALAAIQMEGLEAERAEASQGVARLRERIESLRVRSPMDGTVVRIWTREGERVEPYVSLLSVADTEHPGVELRVPESQAGRVKPGQDVELTVATLRLAGRVRSVGLRAEGGSDSQAATVAVDVDIHDAPAGLIAGSSVTAEIRTGLKQGALTLPRGPWLGSGEARFVFRIDAEGLAHRVPVSLGATRGMEVEVLAGLQEGERVIVSSYQEFRDRESVRLAKKGESR